MFHAALITLAVLAAPAADKAKPATNVKDPVCKMDVNAKSESVVVRGQYYRICSKHCGEALQKDPEKYLEKLGAVKAEAKK